MDSLQFRWNHEFSNSIEFRNFWKFWGQPFKLFQFLQGIIFFSLFICFNVCLLCSLFCSISSSTFIFRHCWISTDCSIFTSFFKRPSRFIKDADEFVATLDSELDFRITNVLTFSSNHHLIIYDPICMCSMRIHISATMSNSHILLSLLLLSIQLRFYSMQRIAPVWTLLLTVEILNHYFQWLNQDTWFTFDDHLDFIYIGIFSVDSWKSFNLESTPQAVATTSDQYIYCLIQ